jgi:hypothetical protein
MANYSNIFVNEGLNYSEYRDLIVSLLEKGRSTNDDNSEEMLNYTKLNIQRMSRIEKTAVLNDTLVEKIKNLKKHYHLLVITEGWCGDAAQIVPLFRQMTAILPEKFDLRFVLRDKNLPLMDAHLTNGARSIPVLLVLDDAGGLVAKWGPRPAAAQEVLNQWKATTSDRHVQSEKLHLWYSQDKTRATQEELITLVDKLEEA